MHGILSLITQHIFFKLNQFTIGLGPEIKNRSLDCLEVFGYIWLDHFRILKTNPRSKAFSCQVILGFSVYLYLSLNLSVYLCGQELWSTPSGDV